MNNILKKKNATPITVEHMMNPFLNLHQEVTRAMNDFYDLFERGDTRFELFQDLDILPAMDLMEEKDCYKVQMEMPGLAEDEIKVGITNNILTINGEKTVSKKNDVKNYISREISYGSYSRSISLPMDADTDKIAASFKKGMLWITIPKKIGAKSGVREITVSKA
jgi:HSP20 family protein